MENPFQPIFILPEGYQRLSGRSALRNNIAAAIEVAETVRTTLGPKGMDKMLVDSLGNVTITNDGVTILKEMEIEHPAAKIIADIAKTQEEEIGDGTTTAVILAGELLKQALELIDQNVHPSAITKGFRLANEQALKIIGEIAIDVDVDKDELLKKIAMTAMTGKNAELAKEHLAEEVVKAVRLLSSELKRENFKIVAKEGDSILDTKTIHGIVIDKERVHPAMPERIENAKIALLDTPLEIRDLDIDAKIQITEPDKIQEFLNMEEQILTDMVDKIVESGANVVFCQKGIDEIAQFLLARRGILAVRRVKRTDLELLAKATGAQIITNLLQLDKYSLGHSDVVYEEKVGDENMIFVEGCKNPKALTILVRGATEQVVEEVKRALEDAIGDCISVIKSKKVVAGAGACEVELALRLKEFASKFKGKEQIVIESFANAVEVVPKTLAENSGFDSIEKLGELRAVHKKGNKNHGLNVDTGKVVDCLEEGILEPMKIKVQAINSASEVASLILRVDDVISAGKKIKDEIDNEKSKSS
ncbi:MAG: archaeal chaperonin [Candidatus Woesearchaeota archaeon]|nr:archaeal chaperonin [Candidatus Woesearchaeota archaeon]MDN5327695.1 archaeal chaperonin [Candidatus Woesearchaeota archaeon]